MFLDYVILQQNCNFICSTVAEVKEFIKGKLDIPQQLPLYFYINGLIPSKDSTMGALYQEYREPDYLLYIAYYEENIHQNT